MSAHKIDLEYRLLRTREIDKTGCPEGHPYDRTGTGGKRFCSICARRNMRNAYARRKKSKGLLGLTRTSSKEKK